MVFDIVVADHHLSYLFHRCTVAIDVFIVSLRTLVAVGAVVVVFVIVVDVTLVVVDVFVVIVIVSVICVATFISFVGLEDVIVGTAVGIEGFVGAFFLTYAS